MTNTTAPLPTPPSNANQPGRFIVTFQEGATSEGVTELKKSAGLTKNRLMSSADFGVKGVDISQLPSDGGVVFEHLGVAVIHTDPQTAGQLSIKAGGNSAILAIESERMMYALSELGGLSLDYLHGFRDAAENIYQAARTAQRTHTANLHPTVDDSTQATWGLQITKVIESKFSGQGIKVAILDTGLDLKHPDFVGRPIVSQSFIAGVTSANDGHGHGTHCTGTACGPLHPGKGPRYGIAHQSLIHIGKVLSDQGSGADSSILAGLDWAVANKCQVISMSLGADINSPSVAYEKVGSRALKAGCLIVAAAGNNGNRTADEFGFVGRPANCRSFMSIGAIDKNLKMGKFSARDTVQRPGTAIDLAAPGVNIYSSWLMPERYRTISGTSMATPHVAGIAALWAEQSQVTGMALWQQLITSARGLHLSVLDVGRGLVQAP